MAEESPKPQNTQHQIPPFLNLTDPNNPYRVENGDNTALVLVTDLLTTDNYATWSRAMRRALRAKNKLGFISGNISKPISENDLLFDQYERCNDMVVSWIQNSISMDIRSSIAFVDDAQAVWIELKDRFTQQNGPRIFQLKRNLANLRQDRDSVSTYFGNLKTIWDEIAIYDPIPACTCGQLSILNDRHQRDRVIQFLMGLNDQYANARDQIMLIEPLPTVNKVFSLIQQQEKHHQLTNFSPTPDSMVLATKTSFKTNTKNQLMTQKRDRPYCTHCRVQGHTLENCFKARNAPAPVCTHCNMAGHFVERCYKLHGYPPGHKLYKCKGSNTFANQSSLCVESSQEEMQEDKFNFTKEQFQQLITLLQHKDLSSSLPSVNQAQTMFKVTPTALKASKVSGIEFLCCTSLLSNSFNPSNIPWIIDSRATDHMICSPSFFKSNVTAVSYNVKLPNGTCMPVTHLGTVRLTNNIILSNVLCMPSFSFNLISVKRLTENLTTCLFFLSNTCFIQDLPTWTTIGMAEVKCNLYQLLLVVVPPAALAYALSHMSPIFPSISMSVKTSNDEFVA
ncbi:uncharacterized protein LOC122316364 [Carya illinoinensis]|uniref:uncharacterized protein LOC122316364 n=1 Tax=Carya illinoinensis TaxID=32201 RepID=UPI001C71FD0A|nr:uncharacterized protein LOC122316364 [Carya illinoinensis]